MQGRPSAFSWWSFSQQTGDSFSISPIVHSEGAPLPSLGKMPELGRGCNKC